MVLPTTSASTQLCPSPELTSQWQGNQDQVPRARGTASSQAHRAMPMRHSIENYTYVIEADERRYAHSRGPSATAARSSCPLRISVTMVDPYP